MRGDFDAKDDRRPLWSAGTAFQAALNLGWKVMDRWEMTRKLKEAVLQRGENAAEVAWAPDNIHVRPYVNHEYTQVFLNMVCSQRKRT
jgi:hypothetical protein